MIHVVAFCVFFAFCLLYSLRFGGGPEKAAMLCEAAAVVFTIAAILFFPRSVSFTGVAEALFMIDLVLLVALCWIALRANRLWTIVLAGLQLSTVLVHVSKAAFPGLPAASYAIFEQFWSWPIMITTLAGTHSHRMRVRRFGPERDWKDLWPEAVQA